MFLLSSKCWLDSLVCYWKTLTLPDIPFYQTNRGIYGEKDHLFKNLIYAVYKNGWKGKKKKKKTQT